MATPSVEPMGSLMVKNQIKLIKALNPNGLFLIQETIKTKL